MPMNPRKLVPTQEPGVLDFAPGAAAAYSLRQLSSSYAGPVVTVRRSSDSAEADFTAGEVNDGTLAAWVGSGNDGFVKTWHDQSGNGKDATQATSTAQPKLVSSGAMVTEGGKPALQFDGSDDFLSHSHIAVRNSQFIVGGDIQKRAGFQRIMHVPASDASSLFAPGGDLLFRTVDSDVYISSLNSGIQGFTTTVAFPASHLVISTVRGLSGPAKIFFNSASATSGAALSATASTATSNLIGAQGTGSLASLAQFFEGRLQEIVIFAVDQSANRQRIEGDINRHFGIF